MIHNLQRLPKVLSLNRADLHEASVAGMNAMAIPGIYFLMFGLDVVYVGQSINMASRIGSHAANKTYNRILYIPVSADDLDWVERSFILGLLPEHNMKGGKPYCPVRQTEPNNEISFLIVKRFNDARNYRKMAFGPLRMGLESIRDWFECPNDYEAELL